VRGVSSPSERSSADGDPSFFLIRIPLMKSFLLTFQSRSGLDPISRATYLAFLFSFPRGSQGIYDDRGRSTKLRAAVSRLPLSSFLQGSSTDFFRWPVILAMPTTFFVGRCPSRSPLRQVGRHLVHVGAKTVPPFPVDPFRSFFRTFRNRVCFLFRTFFGLIPGCGRSGVFLRMASSFLPSPDSVSPCSDKSPLWCKGMLTLEVGVSSAFVSGSFLVLSL